MRLIKIGGNRGIFRRNRPILSEDRRGREKKATLTTDCTERRAATKVDGCPSEPGAVRRMQFCVTGKLSQAPYTQHISILKHLPQRKRQRTAALQDASRLRTALGMPVAFASRMLKTEMREFRDPAPLWLLPSLPRLLIS